MKTLIFFIIVFFAIVVNTTSAEENISNRNCVAVIEPGNIKIGDNIHHYKIVVDSITSNFDDISVVFYKTNTYKKFRSAIKTTPCRVVSISILFSNIKQLTWNMSFKKETLYFFSIGNKIAEHVDWLNSFLKEKGMVHFSSNVTLVAGEQENWSLSCEFIKKYTTTKCVTLHNYGAGSHIYNGVLYQGSSFATPIVAAIKMLELTEKKIVSR